MSERDGPGGDARGAAVIPAAAGSAEPGGGRGWAAGVIVMAKAPVPGRVKTRLCPPCTPEEAAMVAEAALADTLAAVCATEEAAWRTVALDGDPGPWLPPGVAVVAQRGRGLDERLAAAFADAGTPAVVIAADTPQVTPALLSQALAALMAPGVDAVVGPTMDDGYWALGLRRADPRVFVGVPMSHPSTLAAQRDRLAHLGLAVAPDLPTLRDVDSMDDARAVAADLPGSRFAAAVAAPSPFHAPEPPNSAAEAPPPGGTDWAQAGGRR
ncbi:MAG: DUF2064 domain-containing protein [Acidimicrobiales bacterium]